MGCVSSCFRVEDIDEYMNPSSNVYRNCPCIRCLAHNFLNLYISVFRRGETRSLPSSVQATSTTTTTTTANASIITSSSSHDNFLSEAFRSTPRPLPYDADPRYFRSRREKGSSHSHEETEPLRGDDDADSECKWVNSNNSNKKSVYSDKDYFSTKSSSLKISKSKSKMADSESEGVYVLSEDEDVCPTCLEEYTTENPKIVTKCCHHFHLSCIYEWMERSENCPVCGKVMEFNETP